MDRRKFANYNSTVERGCRVEPDRPQLITQSIIQSYHQNTLKMREAGKGNKEGFDAKNRKNNSVGSNEPCI